MEDALAKYPGGVFKQPAGIKMVSTPYGYIPYSLESLRDNVIDSIRDRVMIDGQEIENSGMYYPRELGGVRNGEPETETEIDFLLKH